jgi:hypothetical protein
MSANPLRSSNEPARSPIDAERLAQANINPVTRLATDYLNHFNEAIMLLEMLPTAPEFAADILTWRPLNYKEYFAASHFKERELAIEAYEVAEPYARQKLDELADSMNTILWATTAALQRNLTPEAAGTLGEKAATWLKPLVTRAGGVINGQDLPVAEEADASAPQAVVDALFEN